MKKKYRIVTDNYAGYEVQETFLNIFWIESKSKNSSINTHNSIENAKQHIEDSFSTSEEAQKNLCYLMEQNVVKKW